MPWMSGIKPKSLPLARTVDLPCERIGLGPLRVVLPPEVKPKAAPSAAVHELQWVGRAMKPLRQGYLF